MTNPRLDRMMTLDEYFAFEEESDTRHEYVDGYAYAMSVGTSLHGQISMNVSAQLWHALRGGPCLVFHGDRRLAVARNVFVPDVMVICSRSSARALAESSPTLVVEVLSPSTERIDRVEKLRAFKSVSSLDAYLIVSQEERAVDAYLRTTRREWEHEFIEGDGAIELATIGVTLTLDQLYEGVDLPTAEQRLRLREEAAMYG